MDSEITLSPLRWCRISLFPYNTTKWILFIYILYYVYFYIEYLSYDLYVSSAYDAN